MEVTINASQLLGVLRGLREEKNDTDATMAIHRCRLVKSGASATHLARCPLADQMPHRLKIHRPYSLR
eukprot:3551805-Rhodomonas_salina.1